METDDIRELWKAQPFKPFVVHVADGRSFSVPHPDFLSIVGHGRSIIVDSTVNENWHLLDPLMVTGLEVLVSNDGNHEVASPSK